MITTTQIDQISESTKTGIASPAPKQARRLGRFTRLFLAVAALGSSLAGLSAVEALPASAASTVTLQANTGIVNGTVYVCRYQGSCTTSATDAKGRFYRPVAAGYYYYWHAMSKVLPNGCMVWTQSDWAWVSGATATVTAPAVTNGLVCA